jgi:hypothetical protein
LNSAFTSRRGQFIKDFLDDRFAGFFPGHGVSALKSSRCVVLFSHAEKA